MKTLIAIIIFFIPFDYYVNAQNDDILYSFFVAGHTSGSPWVNNVGFHPPFKAKFDYILSRSEIQFGILTGDIVSEDPIAQDWDEVDADILELGLPVYFAVGNHDMENRPLYEFRYGSTYYYSIIRDDLFIVLDPNIDSLNISGDQLIFLQNVVDLNHQTVANIFVFFHQLLWREDDNLYQNIIPNSNDGRADTINFWSEIEPIFNDLPNEVFMFCGDLGAVDFASDVTYDHYDNISLIGSGMGHPTGENFIVVNVLNNKSVDYDLICLSDVENCLGELTDYQITTDILESNYVSKSFTVYPNPASDYINIEFQNYENSELSIFTLNGQNILNQSITGGSSTKVNVSTLSQGLYIGVIKNEITTKTFKLIIQ